MIALKQFNCNGVIVTPGSLLPPVTSTQREHYLKHNMASDAPVPRAKTKRTRKS